MPLELLLGLVVGGIAAIAALLHWTGNSQRRVMMPEDARAEWHRHFPDDIIEGVTVSRDGHAALIETETGPGLLWAMGADTVGRHLLDYDLIEHSRGLDVVFRDYTAPRATLHLTEDERPGWRILTERP